jgi:hypothetical protein
MILRDRMVYGGIQNSRRMAKLSWFQREFFRGLLHAADDYGRFEADAELLRSVLFALDLSKVSKRDVQEALLRCAAPEVGLVKLYTVKGQGYGKVINFRQTLKKRRGLYPDEEGDTPEPELFAEPATAAPVKERKKEEKIPLYPPPAGDRNSFSWEGRTEATARPRRVRRLPSLDNLKTELAEVEAEMTTILRPGGCAYNVQPEGEKLTRFHQLEKQREQLKKSIQTTRAALETAETA